MPPEDAAGDAAAVAVLPELVGLLHFRQHFFHQEPGVAVADRVVLDGAHGAARWRRVPADHHVHHRRKQFLRHQVLGDGEQRGNRKSPIRSLPVLPHHQRGRHGGVDTGRSIDPVIGRHAVVDLAGDGLLLADLALAARRAWGRSPGCSRPRRRARPAAFRRRRTGTEWVTPVRILVSSIQRFEPCICVSGTAGWLSMEMVTAAGECGRRRGSPGPRR